MSQMFRNYEKIKTKIGPNNEHKHLPEKIEFWDSIYIGANCHHSFKVPYLAEEMYDVNICYMQGTEVKLVKNVDEMTYTNYENSCIFNYEISQEESLLFNDYNSEVYAQIKIVMNDGEIEYSPKYKLRIIGNMIKEM